MVELEPLDLLGLGDQHGARDRRGRRRRRRSSPASATASRWRTKSRTEPRGSRRDQSAASSARRERLTSRSAVSGLAANSRWRRRPTRSIRRRTKTSARISLERVRRGAVQAQEGLNPVARLGRQLRALERRLERRDHVELAPPGDRRDLRQVDRAQVDRRPGERADRPRPRRRGRRASAARRARRGPRGAGRRRRRRRTGTGRCAPRARRRPAGPRASRSRRSRRSRSGAHLAGGEQVLDLARDRLGLGAVVLAAPEARDGRGRAATRRGRSRRARGCAARNASTAASPAPRKRRVACAGSQAQTMLPWAPTASSTRAVRRRRRPRARRRARGRSARRSRLGDVGAIRAAACPARARGRRRRGCRPRAGSGRGGRRGRRTRSRARRARARPATSRRARARPPTRAARRASPPRVLSRSIRRSRRASSPAGLPRISWRRSGSSSRRSSRIARRSAGADGGEERIEAGLGRVLAQQRLGGLLVGVDPELLVRAVEQHLGALAQLRAGGARAGRATSTCSGRDAARRPAPRAAARAPRCVPTPPAPSDQQRALAVRGDRALAVGRDRERSGGTEHHCLAWPRWPHRRPPEPPADALARRPAGGWSRRSASSTPRTRGIEARTEYDGVGEGGDRSLVIDREAEEIVFAELEASARRRRRVHRDLRGARRGQPSATARVADPGRDRPDRRLAQRAPHPALVRAQRRGRLGTDDGRRRLRLRARLRRRARTSSPCAARARTLDGETLLARGPGYGLEVVGLEATKPELIAARSSTGLEGKAYRCRAVGSLAITPLLRRPPGASTACSAARPCRSVDVAAAQLIAREAGACAEVRRPVGSTAVSLDLDARFPIAAGLDEEMLGTLLDVQRDARRRPGSHERGRRLGPGRADRRRGDRRPAGPGGQRRSTAYTAGGGRGVPATAAIVTAATYAGLGRGGGPARRRAARPPRVGARTRSRRSPTRPRRSSAASPASSTLPGPLGGAAPGARIGAALGAEVGRRRRLRGPARARPVRRRARRPRRDPRGCCSSARTSTRARAELDADRDSVPALGRAARDHARDPVRARRLARPPPARPRRRADRRRGRGARRRRDRRDRRARCCATRASCVRALLRGELARALARPGAARAPRPAAGDDVGDRGARRARHGRVRRRRGRRARRAAPSASTSAAAARGGLGELVARLLGIDLKLRQYELGKAFCDADRRAGRRRGAAARSGAPRGTCPTPAELEAPRDWLDPGRARRSSDAPDRRLRTAV